MFFHPQQNPLTKTPGWTDPLLFRPSPPPPPQGVPKAAGGTPTRTARPLRWCTDLLNLVGRRRWLFLVPLKNGCPIGWGEPICYPTYLFLGGEPWKLHGLGDVQISTDLFFGMQLFQKVSRVTCCFRTNFGREFHHVTSHRFDDLWHDLLWRWLEKLQTSSPNCHVWWWFTMVGFKKIGLDKSMGCGKIPK